MYNNLLDERNRLEERFGNLQMEKRGLEELALYVNATRRMSDRISSSADEWAAARAGR